MREELKAVVEEVCAKPHYREVDYERLAEELGEDFLLRRLREQLRVYERFSDRRPFSPRRLLRHVVRPLLRGGLFCMGELEKARALARTPVGITREVAFPDLPEAFDGFRILHLTDFHFDYIPEMPELLRPVLESVDIDLCVLTGDYRGETHGPYRESLGHLRRTRPHLGETVYAVLGNHDNIEIVHALPEMDIRPLVNESVWIERGGERLLLAGIDDPHMYKTHDVERLAAETKASPVSILLSHSAEAYREAEAAGFDYMLSGHTHGGQICLPGGVPLVAHLPSTPRRMISGPWRWERLRGYTSRGIGVSTIDCRWNCPPEYTVHVLRKEKVPS